MGITIVVVSLLVLPSQHVLGASSKEKLNYGEHEVIEFQWIRVFY
ncbi:MULTISPECIES: hypothetical protein [Lysinibacillus]|nr:MULTISPECIES: hypothetical protein [Lysinibacillus]